MRVLAIIFWGFFTLALLVSITVEIAGQFVNNSYDVKVTDKTVKNSNDHSTYLIFTETDDGKVRVFKDTDSVLRGKFNSSDIYGEIKVGKKYHFETYGLRIPFLSRYENIKSVKLNE